MEFGTESARFESGDTLLVPPAGTQVAVSGAVKRPAIYELKAGDATLASVIDDAGGFTAAASLGHITIERIDANRQRETVTLKTAGTAESAGRSRCHCRVSGQGWRSHSHSLQSCPTANAPSILAGHVVRPGRLPYTDGMRLSDVLHSYQDMLPEPAAHGRDRPPGSS